MEIQTLINAGFTLLVGVAGWFAREMWGAMKELRQDLHRLEVALPQNYVQKDDLDKRMSHIEDMFQRIYDKLDNKADKV